MATTIDWETKVITVPRADMLLIQSAPPIEIRQINLNDFHEDLRELEASEEGMPFIHTHNYSAPTTISGVTLARVVEIINGYTVTFEDGTYAVNITGGNSNVSDVVNINNVAVRSANSAGLQDGESLQASSFFGGVAIDPASSFTGTTFPVGTREYPVNNIADAHDIAEARGLHTFYVVSSLTIASESLTDGYTFRGDAAVKVLMTISPGADLTNCEFENVTIQGELDGNNVFRQCLLLDVDVLSGFIHECALSGTITVETGAQASIMSCYSNVPGGAATPKIDLSGAGASLALRGYSGGLEIINATAPGDISLDFESGQLIFASSVTGGTYTVRGIAKVTDNSGVGATVIDETIYEHTDMIEAIVRNRREIDPVTGIETVYEEDGVSVKFTRQVYEDEAGTQTYRGQGVERAERFE